MNYLFNNFILINYKFKYIISLYIIKNILIYKFNNLKINLMKFKFKFIILNNLLN